MKKIENLQITKFFDVKTPVGIIQRGEGLANYSIGIDLYMPRITEQFLEGILEANKNLYPNICYIEHFKDTDSQVINHININDGDDLLAKIYQDIDLITGKISSQGRIIFSAPLQIPTGIGINIPDWTWCEVRTKSSNFQNAYTEVHGTVDMNYTYSVGVQILTMDDVEIKTDQKFAQLVFHEAVPVLNIEEVSQEKWNNLEEIKYKREKRTGGFGSTGMFDGTSNIVK